MRKKIGVVLLTLLAYYYNAQTSCQNAAPFCASGVSGVTFPATTSITAAQPGPNYGCLNTTPNPAWYYLQISTPGTLDILIQGQITNPPPPGPGQDVDFICWGPFSSLAGICNSLTAANTIDCSYSGSFTETLNIPNGITGEYYLVLITNFANIQQDIIFNQYAGTGSTNCNILASSKICAGTGTTVVATNPASLTSANFSLSPGSITNTTGIFAVSPTVTTTYTVYLTGINTVSASITQTAISTVSVFPQPSVVPTVTNSTCTNTVNAFNLGLSFFPASPPPSYTVTWASIPNGIFSPTQTALTGGTLSGAIQAAAYVATITAAGGCTTTASFSISPQPAPAIISLSPPALIHTITCAQPTVTILSLDPASNYTWSNGSSAPITGTLAEITATTIGNYTILAVNPTSSCISSQTFTVGINITAPTSVISPTFQNITCSVVSISNVTASASPSVNITQQILAPQGGTFASTSNTLIYTPGGVGTFTYCVVNDVNGCSTCKTFTVTSSDGFPSFGVVSPQNFTLGCNTKSVATINIINAVTTPTPGGPVSYTILAPSSSITTISGTLSTQSTYTVSTAGTWTVITKDNTNFCETRVPISVLSNTFAPNISAIVPTQILNCNIPSIKLFGQSLTTGVSYLWSFPGNPGAQVGDSLTVFSNSLTATNSLVANYTLTITDNNNTCKSNSIIPMYQNLYPPIAKISNGGISDITCNTSTINLTNQSSTGIPALSIFTSGLPVIGYLWDGPSPQEQGQVKTTYVAGTAGTYTLTAKDLNNGCIAKAFSTIVDNRIYPVLNKPVSPPAFTLDCGASSVRISPIISGATNGFVYNWTAPAGATLSSANTATIATNTIGLYKVLTTNTINGCASSAQLTVINGKLNAGFEADKTKGYAPLLVTFTNTSLSSLDTSNIRSYWNFSNGTSSITLSAGKTAQVVYNLAGSYKVVVFMTKGTCIDTVEKTIEVEVPSQLIIPNVFTPNGDNANDLFLIKSSNLETITILVYDRWGHKVYDLTSTTGNISWDGKNQYGKEVAEGTYFYLIKAEGKDGVNYDKKGTVNLFR